MDNTPVPFGAKREVRAFAPVPMFSDMLQAARDLVVDLAWLRQEIDKADVLCTSMESIVAEMEQNRIMDNASKHTGLAVARLRVQVSRLNEWCQRLELLTTELHAPTTDEEGDFKLPRAVINLPDRAG